MQYLKLKKYIKSLFSHLSNRTKISYISGIVTSKNACKGIHLNNRISAGIQVIIKINFHS